MKEKTQSQRTFIAVTAITVLAVASVFLVYAVILSTLYGGDVSVVTVQSSIWYDDLNSTTPADWTAALSGIGNGSSWYAKINITSNGYAGDVQITWQLQNGTVDVPGVSQVTTITLTGSAGQTIYATDLGGQSENKNWGADCIVASTYRLKVTIAQA